MVKPAKDEFTNDWTTATDVALPQPEVADVRITTRLLSDSVLFSVL